MPATLHPARMHLLSLRHYLARVSLSWPVPKTLQKIEKGHL